MFKHEEGIGHRLGWGSRPALLVIDVCVAYWSKGCNLDLSHNPEAVESPESMKRLVKAARAGNVPVIWAQVRYNHPTMKDAGVQILKSKTIEVWQDGDTRGFNAWVRGLEAEPEDTVIYKRNPSAFFGTTL
ncbi:hypothetical protein B0J14DRAFT_240793 [Halenospora varia]|nr:hypothetical protein B0J14DRAFT_240793 [Halenospora varia]